MTDYTESTRRYNARKRQEIVEFLGGCCSNTACGFSDARALQIDHKHGGGFQHNRSQPTLQRYQYIRTHRDEFQLLCANCNWIKKAERNEVSHKSNPWTEEQRSKFIRSRTGMKYAIGQTNA